LFDTALWLADGSHEVLIVDLDGRDMGLLTELVERLRAWPPTLAVWVVGVGRTAEKRERFLVCGGDVAVPSGRKRDLSTIIQWLVGSATKPPPCAELATRLHCPS
jgi:hypothetical protein